MYLWAAFAAPILEAISYMDDLRKHTRFGFRMPNTQLSTMMIA